MLKPAGAGYQRWQRRGSFGQSGQGNYVASKAGLEGFTRSLAMELLLEG